VKLGVIGGTFDPIHLGHLRAAENAREALGLDRVLFVPAGRPPHRPDHLAPALDRFAMVALATNQHPTFVASDLELRRDGPSYTVDTLRALRALQASDPLYLIVGSDTFPEMASWREPEALRALCTVAVVSRPGADEPPLDEEVLRAADAVRVSGPGLPISATGVRERVRAKQSVRYLVPSGVADYIAKRGLYA
jgi:nicotinate-nucleotide adenylyltransferase